MAERDGEVENVLIEIRQRLGSSADDARRISTSETARSLLARIEADASVAARARDRLPPLMSDRQGWLARLELGLKRFARRATNWFTWEQINFNAATADALRAAHAMLSKQVEMESELRARLDALEAEVEELRRLRREQ
ncbi:MAG: hypothetical protein QOE33_1458 [Acidobacteriota bacterium]|nr:hypothetical protein [Acidobacteriota bacterium]